MDKTHADALAVLADNFAPAFDLILIGGKRSRHDDITPHDETALDLNISAACTEIFNNALEELAVGGKMGFHRAGPAGMQAGIAGFAGVATANTGWLGAVGLRQYAFYHGITIYLGIRL